MGNQGHGMPDLMFSQGGRREDGHGEGDSWGKRMGITVAAVFQILIENMKLSIEFVRKDNDVD